MKKVAMLVVCLLFAVAGVFGVGGFSNTTTVIRQANATVTMPTGLTMSYEDSSDRPNPIVTHNARISALYNTDALVVFTFRDEDAFASIAIESFIITLNGETFEPDSYPDYDDVSEREIEFFTWEYAEVGIYHVSIIISVGGIPREPFIFRAVSESAKDPQFDGPQQQSSRVRLSHNGVRIVNPRSNQTGIQVRANAGNENFFWDENFEGYETTYTTTDDKFLVKEGRYLVLNQLSRGSHTITFTVHYFLREIKITVDDETQEETVEIVMTPKTEDVTARVTVVRPTRRVTVWDVLIGIGILGALGGVLWLMNKLSRNIQQGQGMTAKPTTDG
jgi:hypothetical protein